MSRHILAGAERLKSSGRNPCYPGSNAVDDILRLWASVSVIGSVRESDHSAKMHALSHDDSHVDARTGSWEAAAMDGVTSKEQSDGPVVVW
jgi:hypothetical protein